MVTGGTPRAWSWPITITTLRGLLAQLHSGFALHVRYSDLGSATYELRRDGEISPQGLVPQLLTHRAFNSGRYFAKSAPCADGSHVLPLKPRAEAKR